MTNRFDFDFHSDWKWDHLITNAGNKETETTILNLKQTLSLEKAMFLLKQLTLLGHPTDVRKFTEFEKLQVDLGGSFYGALPDRFSESNDIPIPETFDSLIETAWYFAKIRRENFEALSNPAFSYNTEFISKPVPEAPKTEVLPSMGYEFDLSVITDLLELYSKDGSTLEDVQRIAANPVFTEMLKHRKSLGYVPEPLPDENDLAQFIYLSASKEPLQLLWKWINPCNYFCLADLFTNQDEFQHLADTLLENRDVISKFVLGRILCFTADDFKFEDRLSFAVNFGIRSWATEFSLGTNLVSYKDDFSVMLRTITHETFHRAQLQICPVDPSRAKDGSRKFEDLTFYNYPEENDRKFYEILSYIFLEGTATFVGGAEESWDANQSLDNGTELLEKCFQAIYTDNDFEKAEELLNQGLKSNGLFYALGYHMSKTIAEKIGEKQLGKIISQGSLAFFSEFLKTNKSNQFDKEFFFSSGIINRLKDMNIKL